jgi:aminoglycoside 6'-N-acetyltransferase I
MQANITIRLLSPDESAVLDQVADEVFDEAIDPRWCAEFFADPRHHLVVALDGHTVVGFASAVQYVHPDKAPELWINEVGVAPSHHRLGIGKQLMQALLSHGRALGCRQGWVLTEDDNTAARALYLSAGGKEIERPVMVEFDLA